MWTSYKALCEMGDDTIDPTDIFGVCPAALAAPPDTQMQPEQVPKDSDRGVLTPSFILSQTPLEGKKHNVFTVAKVSEILRILTFYTTTATTTRPMETPMSSASSAYMPKTSLFHGRQSLKTATPSLFETPNLTPIPIHEKSFAAVGHSIGSTNPQIMTRARKVAARLYYPPSPESIPSSSRPRSLFLSGLPDPKRSFSTSVPEDSVMEETPAGVDTARNGRALFANSTLDDTQKEQTETSDPEEEEVHSGDETVLMKGGSDESLKEILELQCVLGAAYRRLCQVCVTKE